MTEEAWNQSGSLHSTFLWLCKIVIPLASRAVSAFSRCVERTRWLQNVQRELWSYLRVVSPPALKASLTRVTSGVSRDLLVMHIADCPMHTKLGKVSSRKHSASPPGLLHQLSWE